MEIEEGILCASGDEEMLRSIKKSCSITVGMDSVTILNQLLVAATLVRAAYVECKLACYCCGQPESVFCQVTAVQEGVEFCRGMCKWD